MPQPGVCGNHLADRIVGGQETSITEYPWMVLIEYTKRNNILFRILIRIFFNVFFLLFIATGKGFHCGGVLINKDYVITGM